MKHLKLFEAYGRPDYMETVFSEQNRNRWSVDLEDFPKAIERTSPAIDKGDAAELDSLGFSDKMEINDHWMSDVTIRYNIRAYSDSSGISDIDFEMNAVIINGTYSIWNPETDDEDTFDFSIEDIGPFDGRVEFETKSLPFYPDFLTVSMNGSFDPKNFTYKVEIGQ